MSGPRRAIGAFSIASIAVLGGSAAVLVAPSAASAAPSVFALKCGYPPGACTIEANHGTYKPGQLVDFHTRTHTFAKDEVVTVVVTGPHHYRHSYIGRSGPLGGFSSAFRLGKHVKAGSYTIGLTGRRDGHHLTSHIKVS